MNPAFPLKITHVDAVAQDFMDRAPRERRLATARHESRCLGHGCDVLNRIVARGIPLEESCHHGCDLGVGFNGLPAIWAYDVSITEGCRGRPEPLFSLLQHPFTGLL